MIGEKKGPCAALGMEGAAQGQRLDDPTILYYADISGSRSFLSLGDHELDAVAFIQRPEPFSLDLVVVHKYITPGFTSDEAVTFSFIEPFDGSTFFFHLYQTSWYTLNVCS